MMKLRINPLVVSDLKDIHNYIAEDNVEKATEFLFLSMPLVLGSIYAFLIFLTYPVLIIQRLKKEEEFLEKELEGYQEYKKKVKYRLFPFVW